MVDRGIPAHNPFERANLKLEAGDTLTEEEWTALPETDSEGACLVDANNGFNMLLRYPMLWNVRHRWAKGSRFAFNTYRHFNLVIVRHG